MPGVRRLTVNRRAVAIIATAAVAAQLIVAVAHLPSLAMAGGRAYDTKTPAIRDGDRARGVLIFQIQPVTNFN